MTLSAQSQDGTFIRILQNYLPILMKRLRTGGWVVVLSTSGERLDMELSDSAVYVAYPLATETRGRKPSYLVAHAPSCQPVNMILSIGADTRASFSRDALRDGSFAPLDEVLGVYNEREPGRLGVYVVSDTGGISVVRRVLNGKYELMGADFGMGRAKVRFRPSEGMVNVSADGGSFAYRIGERRK